MIFKQFWESGGVHTDWMLANIIPVFQNVKKDDPGNYKPVSLASMPGKIMGKIFQGA